MSFAAVLEAAEKAGVKEIGMTDHPHRRGLAQHHEAMDAARRESRSAVKVWIGAELEVTGIERLIVPPNELPLADYFIAAPSHYDVINYPPVPHMWDPVEWADRMMTDMENVPGAGARCLAHPFFTYPIVVRPPDGMQLPTIGEIFDEVRPKRLDHLLQRLAADRVALEISPRMCCTAIFEEFIENMYRRAREVGCRFYTGSDAHRLDSVGRTTPKMQALIQRLSLKEEDLWHPAMEGSETALDRRPVRA